MKNEARDGGDPGRQAVDVVEQVERVGDPDDPDEREESVERRKARDVGGRQEEHDHRRDDGLNNELGRRAEAQHVVGRPEREHQAGPHEQGQQRCDGRAEKRRDRESGHHGASAKERHGLGMPPVSMGSCEKPSPCREHTNERGQGCGKREASEEGEQDCCRSHCCGGLTLRTGQGDDDEDTPIVQRNPARSARLSRYTRGVVAILGCDIEEGTRSFSEPGHERREAGSVG